MPHRVQSPKRSRGATIGLVIAILLGVAILLTAGFLMTRLTRRLHLPNVTGYILAGILMGPCCLNVIPQTIIDGTDFLSDVALAFIAFSAGEFFKVEVLRRNGAKVIVITVLEACLASVAVFILVYGVLHLELSFSIVLSFKLLFTFMIALSSPNCNHAPILFHNTGQFFKRRYKDLLSIEFLQK